MGSWKEADGFGKVAQHGMAIGFVEAEGKIRRGQDEKSNIRWGRRRAGPGSDATVTEELYLRRLGRHGWMEQGSGERARLESSERSRGVIC